MTNISDIFNAHFGEIIFIFFLTIVLSFIVRIFIKYLNSKYIQSEWVATLSNRLCLPIIWIIWGCSILFVIEIFIPAENFVLTKERLLQIRRLFLTLGAGWILIRSKNGLETVLLKRLKSKKSNKANRALYLAMWRLSTIVLFVSLALLILDTIGVSLTTLLALGGVGALGISLAASDVAKNFFGGFMIYIQRNFAIGDWIYSSNKNFEGTVEQIGWYNTRIRSFERRPIFIPNSLITDAIVENPGRMYNRRIKADIGIRYADIKSLKAIIEDIKKTLQENPAIAQDQALMVHFVRFASSSLDINIYCFTKTTVWKEWRDITQEVLLKVGDIIESHGAEIAFPTQTLHLSNENASQN